jgi:DNA-binding MarR family transcriptional regulator
MTNRYSRAAEFRAALRRFLRTSEIEARAAGITPRQYLLLLQIGGSEDGTATVSELVEKLALTQSAVTELVQRAEQAGLIVREASPDDGRVVFLRLSRSGNIKLDAIHSGLGRERAQLQRLIDTL